MVYKVVIKKELLIKIKSGLFVLIINKTGPTAVIVYFMKIVGIKT